MLTEKPPSEDLISGVNSRDPDWETKLVQKYWKPLYLILNRRANDPDLAADIAQDTFVVVIAKIRNEPLDNPNALGAYIRQTGVNLLIEYFRKKTRRKTDLSDTIDISQACAHQQPNNKISAEQLLKLVHQVLNELKTERDKTLLTRYFVYGESKQYLCDYYGLTPNHFDRVLFRARSRLKQLLQVKLNIDLQQVSLANLLSIILLGIYLSFSQQNTVQTETNLFQELLREFVPTHHNTINYYTSINMEFSYDSLDPEPHSFEKRLQ